MVLVSHVIFTELRKVKPKQTRITIYAQLKIALIRLYFQPLVSLTLFIDSELVTCLLIVTCLFQDEFEDETAKSLAVCLNFCLIDELMTPCISKDRLTLLLYIRLTI